MADQTLASLTAATSATGGLLYGTQAGADRKFTLTAAGAAIAEAASAAAQRTALSLNNVTNDAQLKAADLDTDSTMAANSDAKISSQKAVKTALAGKAASSHTHAIGDLPVASQAEAEAGTNTTKVMTPQRTAQAIAALAGGGGGGGASISTPKVCYVETDGNDGTAVVGDPSHAYATSQAAFDAGVALAAPFSLHFGVGTHAGIVVATDMLHICGLTGCGFGVSVIGGINGNGADGAPAADADSEGGGGVPGSRLLLDSDGTVDVGAVTTIGGVGQLGGSNDKNGGPGGSAGAMQLRGLWSSANVQAMGGTRGNGGGASGAAGNFGSGGYAAILRCVFGTGIFLGPDGFGSTAEVRIAQTVVGDGIQVNATGFVAQCIAASYTLTGVTDSGNVTAANAHLLP